MIAKERLYLTEDRKRLVAEGDPKAAFLYCTPGDEIPESAAELFKLVDGGLRPKKEPAVRPETKQPKPAPTKEPKVPETKEQQPDEDKQSQPDENKGA